MEENVASEESESDEDEDASDKNVNEPKQKINH